MTYCSKIKTMTFITVIQKSNKSDFENLLPMTIELSGNKNYIQLLEIFNKETIKKSFP